MVIASSPMGKNSATNSVGAAFLRAYKDKFPRDGVKVLDISGPDALPSFTAARVQSKFKLFGGDAAAADGDEEWTETRRLIEEFKAADKFLFLYPLWNFTIPYTLKLYFDHVVQPGHTFGFDAHGPKGMVTGKPAVLISAAGGVPVGSDMDAGYKYMRAILSFMGFTDVRLLGITGTANPEALPKLLEDKSKEAAEIAAKFDFDAEAKVEVTSGAEKSTPVPAPIKEGARVLFVTASPMGELSATKAACAKFLDMLVEKAKAQVTTLDVSDGKLAPFTATRVQAKFATWGGGPAPEDSRLEWDVTTGLIEQFKSADIYVFAAPMWNLSLPYSLKQVFDHILQPHQTFDPGAMTGLLEGKRAFVVAAAGTYDLLGGPLDHLTAYMKQALGFAGVSDVSFVYLKNRDAAQEGADTLSRLCELSTSKITDAASGGEDPLSSSVAHEVAQGA